MQEAMLEQGRHRQERPTSRFFDETIGMHTYERFSLPLISALLETLENYGNKMLSPSRDEIGRWINGIRMEQRGVWQGHSNGLLYANQDPL
jgi:hypothetical protein